MRNQLAMFSAVWKVKACSSNRGRAKSYTKKPSLASLMLVSYSSWTSHSSLQHHHCVTQAHMYASEYMSA